MDGANKPLTTDTQPDVQYGGEPIIGYRSRQCGCIGVLLTIFGTMYALTGIGLVVDGIPGFESYISTGIIWIIISMGMIWTQIEDRGDHLLLTTGPWRWAICGMGKEKIPYRNIRDYGLTQTCFYGFGINNCSSIKLFNNCSCCGFCGGDYGRCCGHKSVRLTINERAQGLGAKDNTDCCWEACCLSCCCGENGEYIGKGCCCQPICNPCNANCCYVNTVFVSTNDPENFIRLLNQKCTANEPQFANI